MDSFPYLGSIVTPDGGADEDVSSRIKKDKAAFAQLRSVWRSKEIILNTKICIFDSNVKSVLLYGSETWRVTQSINNKLQTFCNRCLRSILGVWWPRIISNDELLRRTKQKRVGEDIRLRKWRWIGHTLRRKNSIAREALEWNPQGQRRIGRPRKTWRSSVLEEAKRHGHSWATLKEMAADRERWRRFILALCPSEG